MSKEADEVDFKKVLAEVSAESPIPIDNLPPAIRSKGTDEHQFSELQQTVALRYWVCGFVAIILFVELIGLFGIVIGQGLKWLQLNEWAFTMLTNGVLLQSFFSFRTIVTHLFPNGAKDFKK